MPIPVPCRDSCPAVLQSWNASLARVAVEGDLPRVVEEGALPRAAAQEGWKRDQREWAGEKPAGVPTVGRNAHTGFPGHINRFESHTIQYSVHRPRPLITLALDT